MVDRKTQFLHALFEIAQISKNLQTSIQIYLRKKDIDIVNELIALKIPVKLTRNKSLYISWKNADDIVKKLKHILK